MLVESAERWDAIPCRRWGPWAARSLGAGWDASDVYGTVGATLMPRYGFERCGNLRSCLLGVIEGRKAIAVSGRFCAPIF